MNRLQRSRISCREKIINSWLACQPRSEIGGPRSEVRDQTSEIGDKTSEITGDRLTQVNDSRYFPTYRRINSVQRPCAFRMISTTSRTAPWPPGSCVT